MAEASILWDPEVPPDFRLQMVLPPSQAADMSKVSPTVPPLQADAAEMAVEASRRLLERGLRGDSRAFDELVGRYWYPLYAWLWVTRRCQTQSGAEARLAEFFPSLLHPSVLAEVVASPLSFREFLRQRLQNSELPAPAENAELGASSSSGRTRTGEDPGKIAFDKAWAMEVFDRALAHSRSAWEREDRGPLFEALVPHFKSANGSEGLAAIGDQFGLSLAELEPLYSSTASALRRRLLAYVTAELPAPATDGDLSEAMQHFVKALRQ